jgi:hypothetical protein
LQKCRNDENDDWVKANAKADVGARAQRKGDDGVRKMVKGVEETKERGRTEGRRSAGALLTHASALGT